MAKSVVFIVALLWAFIGVQPVSNCNPVRDSVQHKYYSQIGVRELSGHNDGREVEKYLACTGLKKGHAWCAAFLCWTFHECAVKALTSAWAAAWFPSSRIVYRRGDIKRATPQRGDVFGLYFPNKKMIAHVGFIDQWSNDVVITVEGNTGSANSGEATREGDGVYRKRRLFRQIYAVSNWIDK